MGKIDAKNPPDIEKVIPSLSFFYENAFYLTSHPSRVVKMLTHYELFKKTINLPGDIIECGVFKGASFSRFAKFRNIFKNGLSKKIIGFDVFGKFPMPDKEEVKGDIKSRAEFIKESGEQSISKEKLMEFLDNCDSAEDVELIEGDVSETIPAFLDKNPDLEVSLLNVDVDLYKPTLDCLIYLFDRVITGGVIILDDYNGFPGATKAVNEFIADKPNVKIDKMPWSSGPFFLLKK